MVNQLQIFYTQWNREENLVGCTDAAWPSGTGSNTPSVLATLDIDRHSCVREGAHRVRQRCQRALSLSLSVSPSLSLSLQLFLVLHASRTLILTACFFPYKVLSFRETVTSHLLFNISVWGVSGCCCHRVCHRDWGFSASHEKQFG